MRFVVALSLAPFTIRCNIEGLLAIAARFDRLVTRAFGFLTRAARLAALTGLDRVEL